MSEPYRVVSALPSGTAFARYLMVRALAQGDVYTELALADRLKDSPTVHATVELQTKAAVAVGTTTRAENIARDLDATRIESERIADAIQRGGPIDVLVDRLRTCHARRMEIEGQLAATRSIAAATHWSAAVHTDQRKPSASLRF